MTLVLLALGALSIGAIIAVTAVSVRFAERAPGDPIIDFQFTLETDRGSRTYRFRWPK